MAAEANWKAQPGDPDYTTKRQALVDAATQIISQDGIEGLKTRELVEKAGIKRSTYYRYFSSKDELIIAVLKQEFDLLVVQISELTVEIEDPIDKVVEGVYQTLVAHRTNARLYNLLGPDSKNCIKLNSKTQYIYPEMTTPLIMAVLSLENVPNDIEEDIHYVVRWLLNTVLAIAMFGSGDLDADGERRMLQLTIRPVLEALIARI